LWCFRRFCVDKLMSLKTMGCLADQIWHDHPELVSKYAPKGLDTVSMDWLSPENVEYVHSPLEEWDLFFSECIVAIDTAMAEDDEEAQDMLSEFLDHEILTILRSWLEDEFHRFMIFPQREVDDDLFTDKQCGDLVQALLAYAKDHPPIEGEGGMEAEDSVAVFMEPATAAVAVAEAAPAPPVAVAADPPTAEAAAQPLPSLTAAIHHRRRTLCLRPRDRSTRGKTRKLLPQAA
jgi:hypothetical protein